MIAFLITAVTLVIVGAIMISLERNRHLTPLTAVLTGLGTLAVVFGAITVTLATVEPAGAEVVPRGVTINQLPERITDVELPTL